MDTKTKILSASLILFNEEGEERQAAIDIANVLEISPGNLYYHFKGKDAIIRALYDQFEEEMNIVLEGMAARVTTVEDAWISVHILFEEIWDMRFFFENLGALRRRYTDIDAKFVRLIDRMRVSISEIVEALRENGYILVDVEYCSGLVKQMLCMMIFWQQYKFEYPEVPTEGRALCEAATAEVMGVLAPFLVRDKPQ